MVTIMDEESNSNTDAQESLGKEASAVVKKQNIFISFFNKIPKKVLRISIILIVILGLFYAGWLIFNSFFGKKSEKLHENNANGSSYSSEMSPEYNFFLPTPEVIVNLRSLKTKGNILRATFYLQLYNREDEIKIKELFPVIIDQSIAYLRDQSVADFEGIGLERVRQALLTRINNVIHPLKIYRVIIKDFVIQ